MPLGVPLCFLLAIASVFLPSPLAPSSCTTDTCTMFSTPPSPKLSPPLSLPLSTPPARAKSVAMPLWKMAFVEIIDTLATEGRLTEVVGHFVPWYAIGNDFALKYMGLDITIFVASLFFITLIGKTANYALRSLERGLASWITSKVFLREGDQVYNEVLEWVSENVIGRESVLSDGSRSLKAFSGDSTSPSIQYNPSTKSRTYFFYGWTLILFRIEEEAVYEDASKTTIILICLGFKTAPLRLFLDDCRVGAIQKKSNMTTFHKTSGASTEWDQGTTRPSRPLSTIDMNSKQKRSLVDDIRKYLRPAGRRFYAHRGIPYRRGYLFHGPPGTGKTSMCLALSGAFNIELFVLDFRRFRHGDTGLMKLFSELPPKCIVLLEDIDLAGLQRENVDSPHPHYQRNELSSFTLAGLLNAIDGGTSLEGRVLIMTSSHPEALDQALIGPGRVDVQVFFGPASRKTAGRIFMRMYTRIPQDLETPAEKRETVSLETLGFDKDPSDTDSPRTCLNEFSNHHEHTRDLAKRFALKIPADQFSPAEIQGYLLTKYEDPEAAIEDAGAWVAKMLESKIVGTNIVAVDALDLSVSSVMTTPQSTSPEYISLIRPETPDSSKNTEDSHTPKAAEIPMSGWLKKKPKTPPRAKPQKFPHTESPIGPTPPSPPPKIKDIKMKFRETILEQNTSPTPIYSPELSPKTNPPKSVNPNKSQTPRPSSPTPSASLPFVKDIPDRFAETILSPNTSAPPLVDDYPPGGLPKAVQGREP